VAIHNFSWVIPDKLAGSALPGGVYSNLEDYTRSDLKELYDLGVRILVSLTDMPAFFAAACGREGLQWKSFPIENFNVPHDDTAFSLLIGEIQASISRGVPVCVHCFAGIGRTGLVLAAAVGRLLGLGGREAIRYIKERRTAFDTREQERYVSRFLDSGGFQQ
jgi:atypical dual specificity phosphatase